MRQCVVAIGNFDGVHTGHQKLLKQAIRRAHEMSSSDEPLPVVVVTFWPHPLSVLLAENKPLLLTSLPERIDLLRSYGADEVRVVQFTQDVASWSPKKFVESIISPLNPVMVVVGSNFTFGTQAAGHPDTLREIADGRFEVDVMALAGVHCENTCSSLLRKLLAEGDVSTVASHLGRLFRVSGVVVVGDQRGRRLGFPTANLPVPDDLAIPADGVYAGWLRRMDDPSAVPMPAAISVGTNPTFDGLERRVESYVLDENDLELYGIEITVEFVRQLRGQVRFTSTDELIDQMNNDVALTREILEIG